MNIDFTGKTAIVTGGTQGIGRGMCSLLIECGCNVIYTGTKSKPTIEIPGGQYEKLDLSDQESINHFIENVINKIKKIDILINNAGIQIQHAIDEIELNDWNKVFDVNINAPMQLIKAVAPKMKSENSGKILNISSIAGITSKPRQSSYSATKAGIIGLTRSVALDLAPFNILVNALCPGTTQTLMVDTILSADQKQLIIDKIPLKRFAKVEEVANMAVYLCSDLNSYVTGQAIIIDGGYTIQ